VIGGALVYYIIQHVTALPYILLHTPKFLRRHGCGGEDEDEGAAEKGVWGVAGKFKMSLLIAQMFRCPGPKSAERIE
jgi:hypothetical protein